MKKLLLMFILLFSIIPQSLAIELADNCRETLDRSPYANISTTIENIVLNIGDSLHKKIVNKDFNYQVTYFGKVIDILKNIGNTIKEEELSKKEILGLLEAQMECKATYIILNYIGDSGASTTSTTTTTNITEYEENIGIESIIRKESGLDSLIKNGTDWEITTSNPTTSLNSMEVELGTEVGKTYEISIKVDKITKIWFSDGSRSSEKLSDLGNIITTEFTATVSNQKIWIQPQESGTTTVSDLSVVEKTISSGNSKSDWVPQTLPKKRFDVTSEEDMYPHKPLKGDGITNDSAALKEIAKDSNITNWYFPSGYTFLLYNINPPSHVTHIWGLGTIKSYGNNNTDTSAFVYGAFAIGRYGIKPNPNLVIDGLTFISPDITGRAGGIIYLDPQIPSDNIINQLEIRNSIFENSGPMNGIKGFSKTSENRLWQNVKIHHNLFTGNGGYFNVELGNNGGSPGDGFPGFEAAYNIFEGAGNHGCISLIILETTDMKVHDNYSNNSKGYWLELPETKGIEAYNNLVLNHNGNPVNEGGNTWTVSNISQKGDYIHNNHFEIKDGLSKFVHLFGGAGATVFKNNFIKGHLRINTGFNLIDGHDADFGDIENNTIVHTDNDYSQAAVQIVEYNGISPTNGIFKNNNLYITTGQKGLISTDNIGPNVIIYPNSVYTSSAPKSLEGAGLSVPISEIGPQ